MCKPSDPRGLHLADQPNATKKHLIIMPTFVDVPEIKLIRTDTTLDLSQKAEKGGRALRRPADESRFSAPQAMTLSRQFYDPGEGAAKRRQLARAWAPRGRRVPFFGPAYRRGSAPAASCSCAAALLRPELSGARGCPGARWSAPRHALGCPCALGRFRLAASLLYFTVRCVYVAK